LVGQDHAWLALARDPLEQDLAGCLGAHAPEGDDIGAVVVEEDDEVPLLVNVSKT
jgi:hypothetical protein